MSNKPWEKYQQEPGPWNNYTPFQSSKTEKRSGLYDSETSGPLPSPMPENDKLRSALLGSQQGLTVGFADELGGGIQASLDKGQQLLNKLGLGGESPTQVNERLTKEGFTGDVGPTSTKELYREARDENRQAHKEAQEANPWSYLGGELAGGVLGFKGAGMALGKAGVAAPALVAAPEAATGLSGALARIGAHSVNAAPLGAAFGLGASEADLTSGKSEDIKQAIKDTGVGAVTGSLVGAGLSTAGEAVGGIKNAIGSTRTASRLKQGFDEGTNFRDPTDVESQVGTLTKPGGLKNTIAERDTDAATELVRTYKDMDTTLGQAVEKSAADATQQGVKVNTSPALKEALQNLKNLASKDPILAESAQFKKIKNNIDLFMGQEVDPVTGAVKQGAAELTPVQAHYLKQEMGDLGRQLAETKPEIAREAFGVANQVRQELGTQVPAYNTAATRQYEFRGLLPEAVLNKGNPVDIAGMRVSGVKNYEGKLLNNLKMVVKGADEQGNPNSAAKETLNSMLKGLEEFKANEYSRVSDGQIEKTLFDKFGIQPERIETFVKDAARQSANSAELAGETRVAPGGGSLGKAVEYTKAAADKAAVLAGKTYAKLGGAPNPVVKTGKLLYSATEPELQQFADRLQKVPGQAEMGKALNKAIKEKNTAAKNAILFAIMQNPALRNLANPQDSGR